MASAVGQVNAYLNSYAEEVNDGFDNPPIGVILCTDKRNIDAHYVVGGLENRVFASMYVTVMPDEEELAEQVRMARVPRAFLSIACLRSWRTPFGCQYEWCLRTSVRPSLDSA